MTPFSHLTVSSASFYSLQYKLLRALYVYLLECIFWIISSNLTHKQLSPSLPLLLIIGQNIQYAESVISHVTAVYWHFPPTSLSLSLLLKRSYYYLWDLTCE